MTSEKLAVHFLHGIIVAVEQKLQCPAEIGQRYACVIVNVKAFEASTLDSIECFLSTL